VLCGVKIASMAQCLSKCNCATKVRSLRAEGAGSMSIPGGEGQNKAAFASKYCSASKFFIGYEGFGYPDYQVPRTAHAIGCIKNLDSAANNSY